MEDSFESFLMQEKDPFIVQSNHCCWWLDDTRNRGISSYGKDLVHSEYTWYTSLCIRGVKNEVKNMENEKYRND